MTEEHQDRPERRRQEKEAAKQGEQEDYGPAAPRVFTKCPVCGCPARFTVEAMKGDLHIEDILGKEPALFSFEYLYETPTHKIKLVAVGDSCQRCGAFYTLARDKLKGSSLVVPKKPGKDGGGSDLILP
ncbi:hypothetical protein LCGC14_2316340 [marine sediment metagenome]|uniref:Uncharacterized protein n=1 Tax=marine sediment metagenome TaxID=412755 RepID=A0A0F9FE21_9ZZZZ